MARSVSFTEISIAKETLHNSFKNVLSESFYRYKTRSMKQAASNLNLSVKKTRKREFLEQMEQVVPWGDLVALITPYYPEGRTGRPPFSLMTMLRIHFMQQ